MAKMVVNVDMCKGCELCALNCPKHIIGMSTELNAKGHRHAVLLDEAECIGCAFCGIICPDAAITVYK